MIRLKSQQPGDVRLGRGAVIALRLGRALVWPDAAPAARSCFGTGRWRNDLPWRNSDQWRNNP